LIAASILRRPRPEDFKALVVLVLLPVFVALPELLGVLKADPVIYVGALGLNVHSQVLPGFPYIDPSSGITTQALGRLADISWLHGVVPWWNDYDGVGMPLAGEYQPAAFSPLTLLLLLPKGMVWRHLAMQIIAGSGCYALLRQLGLGPLASLTGGLLFGQNGTLAWFADAPPAAAVFLPWVLLGIDRAAVGATLAQPHGWRLLGLAMGLMLLAGYPETAYICGLFALVFAIGRWTQCPAAARLGMTWRIGLGGCIGLALAAPQILSFLQFLPEAFIGGHAGSFSHAALVPEAIIPSLLAPYAFGPIFAFNGEWPVLTFVWGNVGGYVDLVVFVLAAFGLASRRDWLGWLSLGWIALCVARCFGAPLLADAWNFIPGVGQTAFYRYSQPSWELAAIMLAASGVEALTRYDVPHRRGPIFAAAAVLLLGVGGGLVYGSKLWPHIEPFADLRHWALGSTAWALASGVLAVALLTRAASNWRVQALAGLLALDATVMFALPSLSTIRHGRVDVGAIRFLQQNLGLQRFYTLGPIAPNYGAYFGIASINHNYIPVPRLWTDWIASHLDRAVVPTFFIGDFRLDRSAQPTGAQELRRNLTAYEEVGVKYVVAPPGANPLAEELSPPVANQDNRALPLTAGQMVQGTTPAGLLTEAAAIGVQIGNYQRTADGAMVVRVCVATQCTTGSIDLAPAPDNAVLWVPLIQPLQAPAGSVITFTILHKGGVKPVALWEYPTDVSQSLVGPEGPEEGVGLQLHLRVAQSIEAQQRVYGDELMSIYELPGAKPYFDALGGSCRLEPQSRIRVVADCSRPDTLLRRELFFAGWQAWTGDKPAAIKLYDDLFQAIDVPAGRNLVTFRFSPPHVFWAWLLMAVALAGLALPVRRWFGADRHQRTEAKTG
jgi:hypothetical protein